MPKRLTQDAVDGFRQHGFHFPVPVLTTEEAATLRAQLQAFEASQGGPIAGNMRHKAHLLFPWAAALVRHAGILDAVEDLLGPDLLCWNSNFFIKEANDPAFVTWHQDATYWGLDPDDVVTAWVALSDAPIESGAMQFLPGSHRLGQLPHADTFHEHNLLSRGQEIAVQVDAAQAVPVPLKAGEMSLHHVKLAHYSGPNTTADRRIGLAIRYIPPAVRQRGVRDGATLVRGRDTGGHHDLEPAPLAALDHAARAAHALSMRAQVATLYAGTDRTEFRA